jgi:hypothetical protein
MILADIKNQAARVPFHPFTIRTKYVRSFKVDRPQDIGFPVDGSDRVTVFGATNPRSRIGIRFIEVLDLDSIEILEVA